MSHICTLSYIDTYIVLLLSNMNCLLFYFCYATFEIEEKNICTFVTIRIVPIDVVGHHGFFWQIKMFSSVLLGTGEIKMQYNLIG